MKRRMAKFYVKRWIEPTKVPVDPEQMVKGWLSMLEMVKADFNAGFTKDWGIDAGGDFGYLISEAANEAELFTVLLNGYPTFTLKLLRYSCLIKP